MEEIWKTIEGYPSYMVSNMGRVKSLNYGRRGKEGIMSPRISGNGHLKVTLRNINGTKDYLVHRLVATHFMPNPNNLPEVNHKDECKTNNIIWINEDGSIDYNKSNLEWCDRRYNVNYGNNAPKIILSKPVIQYSLDGYMLKVWDSISDAQKEVPKTRKIGACCQGKRNKAGGYVWKYYDKETYLIGLMNNNFKYAA